MNSIARAAYAANVALEAPTPPDALCGADRLRARRHTAIVAAALVLAVAAETAWLATSLPTVPDVDAALRTAAVTYRTGLSIDVARAVSVLGQTNVALPLTLLGGALATTSTRRFGRFRAGGLLTAVGASGVVLNLGLNSLIARVRPPISDWAGDAGGFSYPSGHTAAATLAAGLLAWALARRTTSRHLRVAVWMGAAGWALGVAWSRVWLGVHWPTDVLGGLLFGASVLASARAIHMNLWPGDAPALPVVSLPRGSESSSPDHSHRSANDLEMP